MLRIWFVTLVMFGITQYSDASSCRVIVENSQRTELRISEKTQAIRISTNKNIHFKLSDTQKIIEMLKNNFQMSQAELNALVGRPISIIKLVDILMTKIEKENSTVIEKSDKLSRLYNENIKALVAKLRKDQQKPTIFTFAKALLDLEAFKPNEFQTSGSLAMADKPMLYSHITEFFELTKSYIEAKAPYKDIPESGAGVLRFSDIRDIESHNYFPVEFKGHDIRHIHFSSGHPYSIGTVWSAARSKNHLRYVLISGLFEGVDTVQYSWERNLTRHFRGKGLMLEEALMEVALMRQAEIESLATEVGANSVAIEFATWVPNVKGEFTVAGKTGKGFQAEIALAMEKLFKVLGSADMNKYTNYSLSNPGENGAPESDHSIH